MKKTISAISEGGVIYKDYCKHSNNEVSLSFDWRIDITKTGFFGDSDEGDYNLSIVKDNPVDNNTQYNICISSCSFSNNKSNDKVRQNEDGTINISGDGTIDVKVQFTINSKDIIPNQKINYRLELKKTNSTLIDAQSEIFSFSLTNKNALCSICNDENDRGICRIEGVSPIEYIGEGNFPKNGIEVANIVISPVANANENDKVVILYNNDFTQPPTEKDNIKVKYGNVFINCYLDFANIPEAQGGEIIIPVSQDREIRIPVKVSNIPPFVPETQELKVSADIKYSTCSTNANGNAMNNDFADIITICGTTPYRQCDKLNKIKVSLQDPATPKITETINNEAVIRKNIIVAREHGATYTYNFFIKNEAIQIVNPQCGLHVRNIRRTVSIDSAEYFENKEFSPSKEWDLVDNKSYYIHNSENDRVEIIKTPNIEDNANVRSKDLIIPFKIDFGKLGDINIINHKASVDVKVSFEFEYKEDKLKKELGVIIADDDNDNYIPYEFEFILTINRSNIREWHALDFGTSAVVKIKSIDWAVQKIADLKSKKHQLLFEAYPNDENKRLDTGEEDAPNLIASTLFVNPAANANTTSTTEEKETNNQLKDGEKRANKYLNSNLWFSPSSEMPNPGDRLPCIKNLIGNHSLPQIEGINGIDDIKVDDVVSSAYKQLCQYYLYDENIEGLILTVPNSFTRLHIESIRKIAMEQISTLREDKLEFISESDAVLWSYIKRSRIGIPTFKAWLSGQGQNSKNIEHILIFDMGAGTLDISYAECKDYIENDNLKCDIDIIAKIGVNKAGNYIDYLLGEIILKIMGQKGVFPEQWNKFSKALSTSNTGYSDKKKLRNYLRNTVKVMLGEDKNTPLPAVNPNAKDEEKYKLFDGCENYDILKDIKVVDILEDELFKEFIDSCTNKLIEELAKKHGDTNNDPEHRNKIINVDTVILSGRTTSLKDISEKLKDALKAYTKPSNEFILKYRIKDGLRDNIRAEKDVLYYEDNNDKKTVVARGALDYLQLTQHNKGYNIKSNNRIYGSYGILHKFGDKIVDWTPLIDETDYQNDYVYNSKTNEYVVNKNIDTVSNTHILLCHTYIEIPKTLPNDTPENLEKKLDVLKKNRDSITVISKSPTGAADNKIINLTIKKMVK